MLTRVRLVLIRVGSCWTRVRLVLTRVRLVLTRVRLVLARVDLCWYSCIRIDLIKNLYHVNSKSNENFLNIEVYGVFY